MINDIAFLYITNVLYNKIWEPYLKLRKKYYGENIKCYFCTDYLNDSNIKYIDSLMKKFKNVEVLIFNEPSRLDPKNGNYFKRIKFYCNKINENFIIKNYDDYFPSYKLDINLLNKIYDVYNNDNKIRGIKIYSPSPDVKKKRWSSEIYNNKVNEVQFLKYNNNKDPYITTNLPTLHKKNHYIEIINFCEKNSDVGNKFNLTECAPSLYEEAGTGYFRNCNDKIIIESKINLMQPIGGHGGIVTGGKIRKKTQEILKKNENIEIETNKDGYILELNEDVMSRYGKVYKLIIENKWIEYVESKYGKKKRKKEKR